MEFTLATGQQRGFDVVDVVRIIRLQRRIVRVGGQRLLVLSQLAHQRAGNRVCAHRECHARCCLGCDDRRGLARCAVRVVLQDQRHVTGDPGLHRAVIDNRGIGLRGRTAAILVGAAEEAGGRTRPTVNLRVAGHAGDLQLLRVEIGLACREQLSAGRHADGVVLRQIGIGTHVTDRDDASRGAVKTSLDGVDIVIRRRIRACTDIEIAIGRHRTVGPERHLVIRGECGRRRAGGNSGGAIGIGGDVLLQQPLPACGGLQLALAHQGRTAAGRDMGDVRGNVDRRINTRAGQRTAGLESDDIHDVEIVIGGQREQGVVARHAIPQGHQRGIVADRDQCGDMDVGYVIGPGGADQATRRAHDVLCGAAGQGRFLDIGVGRHRHAGRHDRGRIAKAGGDVGRDFVVDAAARA